MRLHTPPSLCRSPRRTRKLCIRRSQTLLPHRRIDDDDVDDDETDAVDIVVIVVVVASRIDV
jgi:hypothetical protein